MAMMGVSEALARAALEQCGSLNAALDAIIAGAVSEPEEQPAQVNEEQGGAAPESNAAADADEEANSGSNADGGGEEDEDASLAAAIALSMAAAAEASERSSPAHIGGEPRSADAAGSGSGSSGGSSDPSSAPASSSAAPSASSLPSDLPPRLVTEAWFDALCDAHALLETLSERERPLSLSLAMLALGGGGVSSVAPANVARLTAAAHALVRDHASGAWTAARDVELVAFANQLEQQHSVRLLAKRSTATFLRDLHELVQSSPARGRFPSLREDHPEHVKEEAKEECKESTSQSGAAASSSPVASTAVEEDFSSPRFALTRRLSLLLLLNHLLAATMSLIDLAPGGTAALSASPDLSLSSYGLFARLSSLRAYVLSSVKLDYLHACLESTCIDSPALSRKLKPKISVDRIGAAVHADAKHSLFEQVRAQLQYVPVAHLLHPAPVGNPHTAFDVAFRGEHALGESGPYREIFGALMAELQADSEETGSDAPLMSSDNGNALQSKDSILPLFLPSPNKRAQLGEHRDGWVLNSRHSSDTQQRQLTFLGVLLGLAVRTGIKLALSWPRLLWKQLLDQQPTRDDLEGIDAAFVANLRRLEADGSDAAAAAADAADAEADPRALFEHHFGDALTWTTTRTDGHTIELRPGGAQQSVDFAERWEYARLAEAARLREGREQLAALKRGLRSVLPASVLSLFGAPELERLVCGVSEVDVALLRRHTEYSGCSESDAHVQFFFTALEELAPEDRSKFISFSYAQQRMPSSDAEFTTRSGNKIRLLIKSAPHRPGQNDDARFMTADTCFWNVSLPRYSSLSVTRRMLGQVLALSSGMDADAPQTQQRVAEDSGEFVRGNARGQVPSAASSSAAGAAASRPAAVDDESESASSDSEGDEEGDEDEDESDQDEEAESDASNDAGNSEAAAAASDSVAPHARAASSQSDEEEEEPSADEEEEEEEEEEGVDEDEDDAAADRRRQELEEEEGEEEAAAEEEYAGW